MNITEILGLIEEFGKPLKSGFPPKIFFFRAESGAVYLDMEAMNATKHKHVPILLIGEMTPELMRQCFAAAREALEKEFSTHCKLNTEN